MSQQVITILDVGSSHLLRIGSNDKFLSVTLIDANHCPGAVMFLFESKFGTILYTGDFRYSECMFDKGMLRINRESGLLFKQITELYLDNTYCHPSVKFPSRAEATQQIISLLESLRSESSSLVRKKFIIVLRNLGKEELLVNLAAYFQTLIIVNQRDFEFMQCLKIQNVFTTNDAQGFIYLQRLCSLNYTDDDIVIIPSGLRFNLPVTPNVFYVQYSDHSDYNELFKFVSLIRPRCIIPIVTDKRYPERKDFNCFASLLSKCSTDTANSFTLKYKCCVSKSISGFKKRNSKALKVFNQNKHACKGVVFSDET